MFHDLTGKDFFSIYSVSVSSMIQPRFAHSSLFVHIFSQYISYSIVSSIYGFKNFASTSGLFVICSNTVSPYYSSLFLLFYAIRRVCFSFCTLKHSSEKSLVRDIRAVLLMIIQLSVCFILLYIIFFSSATSDAINE